MSIPLLNRSLGAINPSDLQRSETSHLLYAIQPANAYFKGQGTQGLQSSIKEKHGQKNDSQPIPAHGSGVNSITIDKFEGKYLLSGGADSSIAIWDLEAAQDQAEGKGIIYEPLGYVKRTSNSHNFGITHISFYAFDSGAFLASSYDHSLKFYDSETLTASANFDLESVVYSHSLSPIAQHVTVACATQHPAIRLVDLRTGASTHALTGHERAVLSVAWSPVDEYMLASGSADGTIRFWDIRRSAGGLGVLDMEDSVGISAATGHMSRHRMAGKAHAGAVNGIVWTDDGRNLVSVGHDERIRVWDVQAGANTLVNFGPLVRNSHTSTLLPVISPPHLSAPGKELLFYPNGNEVVAFELFDGNIVKRLKFPGPAPRKEQAVKLRTTALAWRHHDVEVYSAHGDGSIRAWKPRTTADADADQEEEEEREAEMGYVLGEGSLKRKANVLDDIVEQLTKKPITFG